jgi:hypothetical protein
MKPLYHAAKSVKKYGGMQEDYQDIHDWFDQTKAHVADLRHRLILHNSFGIFLCEQVFGTFIVNSDGKRVNVRDIGEDHVLEDLGTIPSLDKCVSSIDIDKISWIGGSRINNNTRKKKFFPLVD